MHLKCFQITKKDNNSWHCTLYSTFNHRIQTNTTSPKNRLKVLPLNANGIRTKTDKIQLFIKNTQAYVITIQETNVNQYYQAPNISHFAPIRTDPTHKHSQTHNTNVHEANKHLIEAILDADRLLFRGGVETRCFETKPKRDFGVERPRRDKTLE